MTNPDIEALAVERMREIYISGHSEGWTGNQMRRDVQHVDAEKGWELYVQNGALEKTLTALRSTTAEPVEDKRSMIFEVLRRHDVSEQCFAEIAAVTFTRRPTDSAAKDAEIAAYREALEKIAVADFLDFSLAPERSACTIARAALANRGEAGSLAKERAE